MIMQIINAGGGALLSSSFIKEKISNQKVTELFEKAAPYQTKVGIAMVVVGLLALLARIGLFHFGFSFGASFPQAIAAIVTGLLLGESYFQRYSFLSGTMALLSAHKTMIGLATIVIGVWSILFGCIEPVCYVLNWQ